MRTTTNLLQDLNKREIETLVHQVKETIAIGYTNEKQFSSVDLWNIQRQRKAIRVRRNMV